MSDERLTPYRERVIRNWPRERIKPMTVANCLDDVLAELDVLRAENERLRAQQPAASEEDAKIPPIPLDVVFTVQARAGGIVDLKPTIHPDDLEIASGQDERAGSLRELRGFVHAAAKEASDVAEDTPSDANAYFNQGKAFGFLHVQARIDEMLAALAEQGQGAGREG